LQKNPESSIIFIEKEESSYTIAFLNWLKQEFAGFYPVFLIVVIAIGGLAWLLYLGGLEWKPLLWLCVIPTGIITAVILMPVMKRMREWTELH